MDPHDIPLREYLRGEFSDLHRRIDEVRSDYRGRLDNHERILIGNGQPGLIASAGENREAIKRLDAGFSTLAKEVRETRNVRKVGKWGGLAGAISAIAYVVTLVLAYLGGAPPPKP